MAIVHFVGDPEGLCLAIAGAARLSFLWRLGNVRLFHVIAEAATYAHVFADLVERRFVAAKGAEGAEHPAKIFIVRGRAGRASQVLPESRRAKQDGEGEKCCRFHEAFHFWVTDFVARPRSRSIAASCWSDQPLRL